MLLCKYYFGRILPTERHWHGYHRHRHSGLLVLYYEQNPLDGVTQLMGSSLLAPWGIFLLWCDHSHHWYSGLLVLYWHYQGSDRRKLARRRHSYRYWWMMEQHLRPHPKLSKSLLVVGRDFLFLLLIIDILGFLYYTSIRKVAQSPFGLSTGRTIKVAWAAFFLASHITFIKSISPYCLSSKKFTDY